MYQYSLAWFKHLFDKAIVETTRSEKREDRIRVVNEHFTASMYVCLRAPTCGLCVCAGCALTVPCTFLAHSCCAVATPVSCHPSHTSVCRGLFERHKMIFALLLAVAVQKNLGQVDADVWRFILSSQPPHKGSRHGSRHGSRRGSPRVADSAESGSGSGSGSGSVSAVAADAPPNVPWLQKRAWEELGRLSQLPDFARLRSHVVENLDAWGAWAQSSETALEDGIPGGCVLPAYMSSCVVLLCLVCGLWGVCCALWWWWGCRMCRLCRMCRWMLLFVLLRC